MYYDLIGQPLAQTFSGSQFGLSSSLSNPANTSEHRPGAPLHDVLHRPQPACASHSEGRTAGDVSRQRNRIVRHHQQHRRQAEGALHHEPGLQHRPRLGHGLFIQGAYVGRPLTPLAGAARLVRGDRSSRSQVRPGLLLGHRPTGHRARPVSGVTIANLPRFRSSKTCGPPPPRVASPPPRSGAWTTMAIRLGASRATATPAISPTP